MSGEGILALYINRVNVAVEHADLFVEDFVLVELKLGKKQDGYIEIIAKNNSSEVRKRITHLDVAESVVNPLVVLINIAVDELKKKVEL